MNNCRELWQKSRPRVSGGGRSLESMKTGVEEREGIIQLAKVETAGRKQEVGSRKEIGNQDWRLLKEKLLLLDDFLMMEEEGDVGISSHSKIKSRLCPTSKINTAILTFVPIPSIRQWCL